MGQVGGLPKKNQSYPLGEAFRKIMLNFKTRSEDGCFCQKIIEFGEKISKLPSWRGLQENQAQLLFLHSEPSQNFAQLSGALTALLQQSSRANQASLVKRQVKQVSQAIQANQGSQAKQTNQAKQGKRIKQAKQSYKLRKTSHPLS